MPDAIKASFYILLVLPGFIFVQTRDYHLLRENKGQFEKTLEIVLWSAFIWVIVCILPLEWPFFYCKAKTLIDLRRSVEDRANEPAPVWIAASTRHAGWFFLVVCAYAFLTANVWGILRKKSGLEAVVKFITGRDWYPSVAFRFYNENINRLIVVQVGTTRYCGMLFGAPDVKEDQH